MMTGRVTRGWAPGEPPRWHEEDDLEFCWGHERLAARYWRGRWVDLRKVSPSYVYHREPEGLPKEGLPPDVGSWRVHGISNMDDAAAVQVLNAPNVLDFGAARAKTIKGIFYWRPAAPVAAYKARQGSEPAPLLEGTLPWPWPNVEPAPLDPFSLEGIVAAGGWQRLTAKNYQEVQARFGRVELLGLKGGVPTRVIKPTIAPSWDVAPLYWRITDVEVSDDRPWRQWVKDDFERPSSWEKVEVLAGEPPVKFWLKAGEVETIAAPEGSIWWRYPAETDSEKPVEPPPAAAVEPDPVTKTSLTVGQKIPTRGGHTAEITDTNGPEPFPIGTKINFLDGRVGFVSYAASGRLIGEEAEHELDLILPEQPAEPAPLDLTKPVRTRDGRKVRIVATDVNRWERPILALVTWSEEQENAYYYTAAGRLHTDSESDFDLVQDVPEPRKGEIVKWANVYFHDEEGTRVGCTVHSSRAKANVWATPQRIDCVRVVIPWTEGQFDEEPETEGEKS